MRSIHSPMRRHDALWVLDLRGAALGAGLLSAWKESGFLGRLKALGPCTTLGRALEGWELAKTGTDLEAQMARQGSKALVWVEPTQVFLDEDVVTRGLATFDPEQHDYFTQWEHCRLPVGVGVRAVSRTLHGELGELPPAETQSRLLDEPQRRRFHYDSTGQVSYAESLLDARYGAALEGALEAESSVGWSLNGFLALSAGHEAALRYVPAQDFERRDERGMRAAFGFESAACAEFPTYVMFDITNVCNAMCIHCPQSLVAEDGGRPDFLVKREHQTLDAFKRVIDECTQHEVNFVRITADGEPLVHPELFPMLEYARDWGVGPVGLTTNGSLVKEAAAKRLLDSGVAIVDFSLDAASPETFERIRVGLRYDKVISNVLRFLELRDAAQSPVKVVVSFVEQEENAHELDAFRDFWEPLVDEVVIRHMTSNVGLNTPPEGRWPGWHERWPCAHFFRRVVINHRGQLKACPIDWRQLTVSEHVAERSVHEQWHGSFYWSHRMQHLSDSIVESSACHACPDWSSTPWDMGYEKIVARLAPAAS